MTENLSSELRTFLMKKMPQIDLNSDISAQLSSLDLVAVMVMLEEHFKIHIHAMEYDPKILRNFSSLCEFMSKKLQARLSSSSGA